MATYSLPSGKPGQIVDAASVKVWFVNAHVRTAQGICERTANTDLLTFPAPINTLTSGGDPVVRVGDTIKLVSASSLGVETPANGTLETKVLAVIDADTVRVSHVYSLSIATGTHVTARVYREYQALQATSGVDLTNVTEDETFDVLEPPMSVHGPIEKAEVHAEYRALRRDLPGVLEIADITDAEARLGDLSPANPLGLAVKLALANTVTTVKAMSVKGEDLEDWLAALEYLEGDRKVYSLVPLTQEIDVIAAFQSHVTQMSTPEQASWRVAIVNTDIPDVREIGEGYTGASVVEVAGTGSMKVISHSSSGFLGEGYESGDIITATGKVNGSGPVVAITGPLIIDQVLNNNQISVMNWATVFAAGTYTEVSFTVTRTMTKYQKAEHVATISRNFNNKRVWHVQPDEVGVEVDGATQYVPGYFLCAGLAGAVAGFPVQQGLTNIGLAGFTDLKKSNFYFTRSQLNAMAEKGTCLYVQDVPGGIPYCRHELTTDISVLAYREILKVKNLDYLSYYYYELLRPFIGVTNITDDTLNHIRQVVIAGSEQLLIKKLPKIGAPLVGYDLKRVEQNVHNRDNIDVDLEVAIVDPNNYTNLTLFV